MVLIVSPLQVVHAGKGTSFIGEPKSDYTTYCHEHNFGFSNYLQLIENQFSPIKELNITVYTDAQDYTEKLLPLLQTKLVINACLNPLTALFECLNGWIVDVIDTENQTLKNIDLNDHPCSTMIKEICKKLLGSWLKMMILKKKKKMVRKKMKLIHQVLNFQSPSSIYQKKLNIKPRNGK